MLAFRSFDWRVVCRAERCGGRKNEKNLAIMNQRSYICTKERIADRYNKMKGRPKNVRRISFMPTVSGFKPYGGGDDPKEDVFLFYEEYESIRLNDYQKHSQCEAAVIMGVSRPTFTRIYMHAREKIARAFIEGRRIVIEGGKVCLDEGWYVCGRCGAVFSSEGEQPKVCALCGSDQVAPYSLPEAKDPMSLCHEKTDGQSLLFVKDFSMKKRCCSRKLRCEKLKK